MNPFRFGVVASQAASGADWAARAQRAEALGYDSFLVPDRLQHTISPLPALGFAAAVTREIHLGTYVLASGLHNPVALSRQCLALDTLSGGRFEVGLGTGVSPEEFEKAGVSFGTPAERLETLTRTLATLRQDNPQRPALVAGRGRSTLAFAAREADTVGLAAAPNASLEEVAAIADRLREAAAGRAGDVEININLLAVGDGPDPVWLQRIGLDLDDLRRRRSPFILTGSPSNMRDQLLERREVLGATYFTVNDGFLEQLAPVISLLREALPEPVH
ncbi:MAG TPA: LLM class flavin-dependent oxidoreductase [Candidatus Dormibacteraeota bacterium]